MGWAEEPSGMMEVIGLVIMAPIFVLDISTLILTPCGDLITQKLKDVGVLKGLADPVS